MKIKNIAVSITVELELGPEFSGVMLSNDSPFRKCQMFTPDQATLTFDKNGKCRSMWLSGYFVSPIDGDDYRARRATKTFYAFGGKPVTHEMPPELASLVNTFDNV